MNHPTSHDDNGRPTLMTRRQLLKAAGIGAGLVLLPSAGVFALTRRAPVQTMAASAAIGYLPQLPGPASGAIDDTIVNGLGVAAVPATYALRVFGVATDVPLSVDAHYADDAQHRFWQAWSEQGILQRSPPVAIRWCADKRNPLPLAIRIDGQVALTQVTARRGIYVLAMGSSVQTLPAWNTLALRLATSGNADYQLVSRSNGHPVTFPYALLSVQPIASSDSVDKRTA
ncbi:MAG: hypothetical protein L0H70_01110 [Xanthomonadales bacterium]|nr:hypothetical protein [Xanthomonadales bacterium]